MDLKVAKALAFRLMAKHGLQLPAQQNETKKRQSLWLFRFDNAVRRFGACWYEHKTIRLSRELMKLNNEQQVQDVILNEIAHALAGRRSGHGPHWKQIAVSIGCNGLRYYDPAAVKTPSPKWSGDCPRCKQRRYSHRRRSVACGPCCKLHNNGNSTHGSGSNGTAANEL